VPPEGIPLPGHLEKTPLPVLPYAAVLSPHTPATEEASQRKGVYGKGPRNTCLSSKYKGVSFITSYYYPGTDSQKPFADECGNSFRPKGLLTNEGGGKSRMLNFG